MIKTLVLSLLLALTAAAQTTTVTDIVHAADGSLTGGYLYVIPIVVFASGAAQVYATPIPVVVNPTTGVFSVNLYPNDTSVPPKTWYIAQWHLNGPPGYPGPGPTEYWVVPTSGSPVGLNVVRSAPQSIPAAVVSLSQLTCTSCTVGQVIYWDGTSWTNGVAGVTCNLVATTSTTCVHNLNSAAIGVDVYDNTGQIVRPKDVELISINSVRIRFDAAFTGTAYIK